MIENGTNATPPAPEAEEKKKLIRLPPLFPVEGFAHLFLVDARALLTVEAVCELCSIGRQTFYAEKAAERMKTCKLRNRTMVKAKDLADYIDGLA